MLVLVGIVLVAFGASDLFIGGLLGRRQADRNPSGLGAAEPAPAARLLRVMGIGTILAGVVLIVVGARA